MIAGGTVGAVIALCAVINLFCSVKYNVNSRKYYLTVMRAIGARDSVVPKLFMLEAAIAVGTACCALISIGFGLSVALKFVLEKALKFASVEFSFVIPWGVIAGCVFASAALLCVLGLLFAWSCTVKLSRTPIVEVLKDNG